MQNQNTNTWPWPQAAVASSSYSSGSSTFPAQTLPTGNVDPSTLMATYQQLYGAAAAAAGQGGADYDPSQWTAAQMHQWQQWQQWQEKFQEWQTQYGKKYAETMAAMGQSPNITMPGFPPAMNLLQKTAAPAPNPGYSTANPPLPLTNQPVPPPPPEEEKPPPPNTPSSKEKKKPKIEPKDNPEELSEAEKTFDEQFKQWEGQFNEWKKQNQDHPDKTQYREYEKKWEQWREQLLQRREQMRKKRLSKSLTPNADESNATASPEIEEVKTKSLVDQGIAQSKPSDSEYSYSTQPNQPTSQISSYNSPPLQFDMRKPPPFGNQQGSQSSFNQGNVDSPRNPDHFFNQRPPPLLGHEGPKNMSFNHPPANPGSWGKDNTDFNRQAPFNKFQNVQSFNRDAGPFGRQSPNFEGNKERNFDQGPSDGNLNKKFCGQNFDNRNFGSDSNLRGFGGPDFNRSNDFLSNRFGNDNFDDDSNDNFNRAHPKFGGNSRDSGNNERGINFGRNSFNNAGPRGKFDSTGTASRFTDQNFNQGPSNERANSFNERNYNNEMKSLFDSVVKPPGGKPSLLGDAPGSTSLLGNPPGHTSLLNNPSNSLLGNASSKSKVPSLFDITFDKPPALIPENKEKKPWEKYEKDDYFDDPFEDKEEEEFETGPRSNNSGNNFNANKGQYNTPWVKPWEKDRANIDKNAGPKLSPWQKGPKSGQWDEKQKQGAWDQGKRSGSWQDNPDSGRGAFPNANLWTNENNQSKDLEKAELSGYVGNILAKLGNINADSMPPNFTGRNEGFQQDNSRRPNFPNRGNDNDENRFQNNIRGNNFARGNNRNQRNFNKRFFNDGDNVQNTSSPREYFQGMNSPRDNFKQNEPNRNFTNQNQNRLGPKQDPVNLDQVDETSRGSVGTEKLINPNIGGPPNRNTGTDFTDDVNLSDENFHTQEKFPQDNLDESELFNPGGDVDDRNPYNSEPTNLDRDEENSQERSNSNFSGKDNNEPFLREDRGPFGKEELGNFGNNERILERDNGEKKFGRDNRNFRGGRNRGRRGFDRDDRDDRVIRGYDRDDRRGLGPYDRYSRGREYPPELEWNPQVFDYSAQTRTHRYLEPEDIFKFSTVVDYSHGQPENKQTFDYGHGGKGTEKKEEKTFDFELGVEPAEVIDYGHGSANKEPNAIPEWKKEKEKEEIVIINEVKNEVKITEPVREPSLSPPPPPFRRSSRSPPFRGRRSRSRDRFGRPLPKRNNRKDAATELKPQTTDKENSKNSFDVTTVLVEDIICTPGRLTRPNKLVFIMRGLPGSGKTYVTKLIKDKEIEMGGDAPRILSLDDYFMTEVEKEVTDPETGRKVKSKVLEYEYESAVEPHYRGSLLKAFKKTISDGFFGFVIVDSVNEKTKHYEEMWSFAKQKGFQVYVAEMDDDVTICTKRNIHKRTEKEIQDLASVWEKTPNHFIRLDIRSLLQAAAITEVEMEVVSDTEIEKVLEEEEPEGENRKEDEEEDDQGAATFVKSRWDNYENSEQKLDRLDGLKRRREGFHATMEDYLQLPDDVDTHSEPLPGKKRVRWADLEERRQQEKMRAIGFVVGQTDWQRMTDPTFGESALTRTKYI